LGGTSDLVLAPLTLSNYSFLRHSDVSEHLVVLRLRISAIGPQGGDMYMIGLTGGRSEARFTASNASMQVLPRKSANVALF
jgi:hypothetical protein